MILSFAIYPMDQRHGRRSAAPGIMSVCTPLTTLREDMVWKSFSHQWRFVRGMHRCPLDSYKKTSDAALLCIFIVTTRINLFKQFCLVANDLKHHVANVMPDIKGWQQMIIQMTVCDSLRKLYHVEQWLNDSFDLIENAWRLRKLWMLKYELVIFIIRNSVW